MKQGRAVEAGTADEIFAGAKEAYTRDLIDSVPGLGSELGATIETSSSRTKGPAPR
ncbi:hypothetical protein JIM95_008360 [Corynebacterium sp. CCM 8835]|uniref:Uncharacterized protein n=1 Tax=Corynebacterium antarcticum TaxID=2800405 RepID=A0A9Q4CFH3_9CORY|nr:hypothetical protein [Corynebacterium antarcticum]MCK7642909.1 hypothetical protein [Corynebacterium antarcticum]MCK7661412.1 hypothetical protein [Corynebacterium antarcticum]MCL0246149.1 hypothetical protein [Corynebacterium antarcticum]MCX7492398.1 hypothetical protein [Corynebacterium antarcticum]MCX7538489.1 hypothetical protein [Corynebacterium antarcticum]